MVGVVRVVRVVHGDDVGQNRRPHIIVVVGGDAHELRAFDQERGVADIGEPHLVGVERGEIERGGNNARPIGGDEAGTVLRHFRLGGAGSARLLAGCAKAIARNARTRERRGNDAPRCRQSARCAIEAIRLLLARPRASVATNWHGMRRRSTTPAARPDPARSAADDQRPDVIKAALGDHDPLAVLPLDRLDATETGQEAAGADNKDAAVAALHQGRGRPARPARSSPPKSGRSASSRPAAGLASGARWARSSRWFPARRCACRADRRIGDLRKLRRRVGCRVLDAIEAVGDFGELAIGAAGRAVEIGLDGGQFGELRFHRLQDGARIRRTRERGPLGQRAASRRKPSATRKTSRARQRSRPKPRAAQSATNAATRERPSRRLVSRLLAYDASSFGGDAASASGISSSMPARHRASATKRPADIRARSSHASCPRQFAGGGLASGFRRLAGLRPSSCPWSDPPDCG